VTKAKVPRSAAASDAFIVDQGVTAGDRWITVRREQIRDTLEALRSEGWTWLSFLTCVDHLEHAAGAIPHTGPLPEGEPAPRFEVVYELRDLRDLTAPRELRVRAFLPAEGPTIDSVADLFSPAGWDEREMWDLFGVRFEGHPKLSRILMPDDWEGHPLRRDYPVGGEPVDFSQDHEVWQTRPERG
jgi:NADH-quinone oxidoreductase subunit C